MSLKKTLLNHVQHHSLFSALHISHNALRKVVYDQCRTTNQKKKIIYRHTYISKCTYRHKCLFLERTKNMYMYLAFLHFLLIVM